MSLTQRSGYSGSTFMHKTQGDGVAILLCTRRGARFLRAQLESIAAQSHTNWSLYASDDGSEDQTLKILAEFREQVPRARIEIRRGPEQGFVANFLGLACASDIEADYFAFCDQDDVWRADKLSRALQWLSQVDLGVPALYCSRTELIDGRGKPLGLSPLFSRAPDFGNAIVQSIAGGNTMVFNAAARRLLMRAGCQVRVPAHDWWLYILVTAMGGRVHYDAQPSVLYRLHHANVVGAHCSLAARWKRLRLFLRGRLRRSTDMHMAALVPLFPYMSVEARGILCEVMQSRCARLWQRMVPLYFRRVYRQTVIGDVALFLAFLLRKA